MRLERRCEGGAELFLCLRLGQQEVPLGYSQWEKHKEQAFCGKLVNYLEANRFLSILQ